MAALIWQLNALLRKNFIMMRRNITSTIAEIFFPIVLMVLVVAVRKAFTIETFIYETVEKTDANFFDTRSLATISTMDLPALASTGRKWNGLNASPLFGRICMRYLTVALVGPSFPDAIKKELKGYSMMTEPQVGARLKFPRYESIEALEEYISSKNYGVDEANPALCLAIYFEKVGDNAYNYSLHYVDERSDDRSADVPSGKGDPLDEFQFGPDMKSYELYAKNGYVQVMKIISDHILRDSTSHPTAKINLGIMPQRYSLYKKDPFGNFIGFIFPFFVVVAYMCPLCIYVFRMVKEKETRAKEGMKIMGMGEGTYFLSYFLQFVITNSIYAIINSGIIKIVFSHIPYSYLLGLFWLYGMDVFALAFFMQSFIDKTRIAMVLSLLVYFVMFFISIAVFSNEVSKVAKGVVSLFPPVGILLGVVVIGQYEANFKYFDSSKVMKDYANYNLNLMYLMFLIDFLLYLFLGYYLQNVIPHQYGIVKPFYFLCTKSFWCKSCKKKKYVAREQLADGKNETQTIQVQSSNENFQSEALYKNKNKKDDVLKILNIKKTFDDKKTAVDGVSLNIYKDEIFALLGHNGAGKSTLISMLSGLYEATAGEAFYNDANILEEGEMNIFRSKLGICPQHDVLFEDLTISEHLNLFCYFKGVPNDRIKEEMEKTIGDFHIEDIKDIVVKNLSAGQRRKLSIAIALIGGSEVIFLDEPSSGMDITSRRNLWEILKRCSENKIIILTTHYMEEASVLGNRIGIISDGKMRCVGSSLFLIERFGKFVSLVLTKQEDAHNEAIIDFIRERAPKFEYEILSEEILVRLPKKGTEERNLSLSSDSNSKRDEKLSHYDCNGNFSIQSFFKDLDDNLEKLKIKSYGASMPTLEDVFLNVASIGKNKLERTASKIDEKNDKILFEENYVVKHSPCKKFCVDLRFSLKKRAYQIFRDMKSFSLEILCPIILIVIGLGVSQVKFRTNTEPSSPDIRAIAEHQTILYSSFDPNGLQLYKELGFENDVTDIEIVPISELPASPDKTEEMKKYMNLIYDLNMNDCYNAYYMLNVNENLKQYNAVAFVNAQARHGVPYYAWHFFQNMINHAAGKPIQITFESRPFPETQQQKDSGSQMNNSVLCFFVAIAFSLIPANFITIIVKERENNSKHLQKISGISLFSYWVSNYIFEIVKYYVVGGISMLLVLAFDVFPTYLYVLYLLYGPAMISFTYMLSFCFKSESAGQNTIILVNFLFGALGNVVVLMLRMMDNSDTTMMVGRVLAYIFRLIPAFGFSYGFNQLLSQMMLYMIDYPKEFMKLPASKIIELEYVGTDVLYLGIEIVVYTAVLFLVEHFSSKYSAPPQKKLPTSVDDSQVLKEIERANKEDGITLNDSDTYSVRIKNLQKNYKKGSLCNSETVTGVKNLSFCLEYGECFGLLGVNGAGKTTAFKCLTQELSPSNGSIAINGIDISNRFEEVRNMFGYCPQFDAIFEYMTVYENLEFYAALKGVRLDYIDTLVTAMLSEMCLTEYRKKVSGNLSGGNKRKLTVAIAMICNPPIVLLDEPSTGMDPEARRFMWAVIHKISTRRKKSTVIMTTHSMDEAETLCRRMAIMVNGEFKCMGSAQAIKEKYGYGYELDLRVKPLEDSVIQSLLSNYKVDPKLTVTENNITKVLNDLRKSDFVKEFDAKRLGKNLVHEIELNGKITLTSLMNWCHYVTSVMNVIKRIQEHFDDIILTEFIENNFLFKIKKNEKTKKSIGFLFGLVETIKEENSITEYSIQQTSLEQIFNQFALQQGRSETEPQEAKIEIPITTELIGNLITEKAN